MQRAPATGGLELLGIEPLEAHARYLASSLSLAPRGRRSRRGHLRRLEADAEVLRQVYAALADDARRESVPPAAEWLLDNFHLISAAARDIHHDLPTAFFRSLPGVAGGEFGKQPRIYALAVELIRGSGGRLDEQRLHRWITAFQAVTPLTIGEIWAWPSALKLGLVEQLCAHAGVLAESRRRQQQADRLVSALERGAFNPHRFPRDVHPAFVTRLLRRSREYGAGAAALRQALDAALAARGHTLEDAIRSEGRHQAAEQATMASLIGSLRLIGTFDWSEFFENVSLVEQVLRRDPAGVYSRMDFRSRDRYRQAIEELSPPTGDDQLRVALKSIERARDVAAATPGARGAHIGEHLIGRGRPAFEQAVGWTPRIAARVRRLFFRWATPGYLGTIALGTAVLIAGAVGYAILNGWRGSALAWVVLLTLVPASELVIQIVQRIISALIPPSRLPRLALDRVPASARTMVIVPTILDRADHVADFLAHLEVQALGNVDPHVHFAVLSDFRDAPAESLPGDAAILDAAREGIEALNRRHGADRFFLFHRQRQWNEGERRWMGWERKRGKIEEFNQLLRGATDTTFNVQVGDLSILPQVRYCLTLDTDTRLPRDTARELIGIITHPLNRAVYDPRRGRVVEGYGILQPRISVTFMSAAGSLFARMYAGHTGVDPYTTAVSDTYQDLFDEGIFTGKGLYDVDAFGAALADAVPENALLSHDLFEGLHARVALVSDVELVDDYPASVLTHARRQHRWIRGDWQILFWLFPLVPSRRGWTRNRIPLIGRWKVLDNLRRSLVDPALLALTVAGWTVLPGSPAFWTAIVTSVLAAQLLPIAARLLIGPTRAQSWPVFFRNLARDTATALAQILLGLTFLPFHAVDNAHAIAVTLVRLGITRRRLLEWETAASTSARIAALDRWSALQRFVVEMASSPIVAILTGAAIALVHGSAMLAAAPLLLLWLIAPVIAYWLSIPVGPRVRALTETERTQLRLIARRTWAYFETFATAGEGWLPPDNFQETDESPLLARRTSPTNIGMGLLATLAARDLGFISTDEVLTRVDGTLTTLEGLERHEGHFFNWYDTATRAPLNPRYVSTVDSGNLAGALIALSHGLLELEAADAIPGDVTRALAARAARLADEMRFEMLYDRHRRLFAIGYRLPDSTNPGRLDQSFYDLLASEARLASFVAIAKGDIPQLHWFHLGRLVTNVHGRATLMSWGGTMFEYLMPLLVMKTFPGTLLDQSCRSSVRRQMEYGRERGVPWGISESAYAFTDRAGQYQYRTFGVPGLGLRRGLADELVVAPYATALASLVDPAAAVANFARMERAGLAGRFGFYEALDYQSRTAERADTAKPADPVVVRAFFAHHQGMSLVALANVICGDVFVRRFHADPRVQATELLLQERIPREAILSEPLPADAVSHAASVPELATRRFKSPHTTSAHTQCLSNGRYTVALTNSGGGFSTWGNLAVTRRRDDRTSEHGGQFIYLRDPWSNRVWSPTYQPVCQEPAGFDVTFDLAKVTYRSSDEDFDTELQVAVSAEDDVEVRRLAIVNRGAMSRELEVTSYAEIVLAKFEDDLAHPAFSNLFVETEFDPQSAGILFSRRRRDAHDLPTWAFHVLGVEGHLGGAVEWETDRARFLGRGRSPANPIALDGRPLSGTVGAVLDPIASLCDRVRLPPGAFARITFTTGVAPDRDTALALMRKYRDGSVAARAFSMAFTHVHTTLQHLDLSDDEAMLFDRLASRVFGLDASCFSPNDLERNPFGQPNLWGFGISGDLPIVLLCVHDAAGLPFVRQLLQAQEWWRLKGLRADLVVLNEHPAEYLDETQKSLTDILREPRWAPWQNVPGGVFLLRTEGMAAADRHLLLAAARVVVRGDLGSLATQLDRPAPWLYPAGDVPRSAELRREAPATTPVAIPPLVLHNGLGGFSADGREYVIVLEGDRETPLPWSNVLANPDFGTIVTTSGSAFTWAGNSRENRLTPFANDPVTDPTAEAIYLRDEESGVVWGATPGPLPRTAGSGRWVVRHTAGITHFEHAIAGLTQSLAVYVAPHDQVKVSLLTLSNTSSVRRRIAVFGAVEWCLGPPRAGQERFIVSEREESTGALLARNAFNTEAAGQVAFWHATETAIAHTCDRGEFIGRHRSWANPAALHRARLLGRVGAGLDPCAALQIVLEIEPGESRRIAFVLGQGRDRIEAVDLAKKYSALSRCDEALKDVERAWDTMLGAIQVKTPDDSFDLIVNRWLPYQTLACRIWARSGPNQPGGAYGFRDQLQDVLALLYTRPDVCREHLIRASARQFVEGDVQHWWHPSDGRGTRTRCSDDLLWLPYALAAYVSRTGDASVLDEAVPYLEGPALEAHQSEAYFVPRVSEQTASVFDHAVRAIDHAMKYGAHGLPLIGSGDWNDGMNRVGHEGRGESVWLGWFLVSVLDAFGPICAARNRQDLTERYRNEVRWLNGMLDLSWDGGWYRRAYFDDGTPLGSVQNEECKLDSLTQSWAVLSGTANPERAERAMDAVRAHLVRRDARIVLLLTPPFDRTPLDPGYIKGYLPGVRENGGQYTHAALWTVLALTRLGHSDEAMELFHMINPINHMRTAEDVERYRVEPYVVAADVYAHPMHLGRGGWTWYTGSAGWMYQTALEGLLGLRRRGAVFSIHPCIPAMWPGYTIDWRFGRTRYRLTVANPRHLSGGVESATLDGAVIDPDAIPLADDGGTHEVSVVIGTPMAAQKSARR
jgi:cyclic beta-1,2-glucan synthetase